MSKGKESIQVGTRFTPEQVKVIDEQATQERRNRASLMRVAMAYYIEHAVGKEFPPDPITAQAA